MNTEHVLEIFKTLTAIPRESGHEEPVTLWLQNWAKERNLSVRTDSIGNVCITKEASRGKESIPTIVLQAHQDMVCEKNSGVEHDFSKDPISYVIEDGWMIAKDTTLGADDGIGIAAALAMLESDKPTGRIEALFTISEETGMDGAEALQEGFFTGKTLINLDSEDEGQLFIGCAGGLNTNIKFQYREVPVNKGWIKLQVKIFGGVGGHSGDDINKDRCNTVQQMARFLNNELATGLQLVDINGGGKPNAIARECEAVICVPDASATAARLKEFGSILKEEFHHTDPGLETSSKPASNESNAIDCADNIIRSLFYAPHGVFAMSQDIHGLVQTSTNLASVKIPQKGTVEIVTSQRSSAKSERRMMAAKVKAAFELAGASIVHAYEYPGWNPNMNSHILKESVKSYKKLFNVDPEVKAIHAGLECGLFLEKFPDLDMISFGPTLRGVHAPGEKLELASLYKFNDLLEDIVCNFK